MQMTWQTDEANIRPLEGGVVRDFSRLMSYGDYLALHEVLGAQRPRTSPEHPDELMFIIQHQTTELWLKLAVHELRQARDHFAGSDVPRARKCLNRVKNIQRVLTEQWSVLATLTPTAFVQMRPSLGSASGFQSYTYRAIEFVLGNKNAAMLAVFEADAEAYGLLSSLMDEPTVYDEFLRLLARQGYTVPDEIVKRDVRAQWVMHPELVPVFQTIYESADGPRELFEACEDLVDIEDNFQAWRYRHLRTVQRMIGSKPGSGGSSGMPFLERALKLTFFPELFAVRTEIRETPYV